MKKGADLTEQQADSAYLNTKQERPGKYEIHPDQQLHSLVARLRAGDRGAAAELVDDYYQRIYLFMRRLGHDRQVSEDLTQESFFNAWHHIGQLRDGKALDSWLYRIAANVSKLYWRRHKHKEVVGIDIIDMADGTEDGRDRFGLYEQLDELKTAVEKLPRKLKETIVLHYMQQLTIAKAAEALDIKEGTFKSRLNKALKTLRKDVS
ncbi:MAG: RNA polymerase sigma factor [Phycisphaerales bacterium]|nr:MAG: RNA polymerase sigma factor [Phycisphaerales bacterium]